MKYFFGILIFVCVVNLPGIIFAATPSIGTPGQPDIGTPGQPDIGTPGVKNSVTIENPIKAESIVLLFQTILDIVMVFAVPLIVFFIIYAGFLYVTAQGNSGEIEKAHKALLYALIGGLLILGARVLIEVIQGTVDSIIKK